MPYNAAYYMSIGRRDNQEDCIFVNGRIFQESIFEGPRTKNIRGSRALCVVCDGMGGHAKGEWASRFVCEKLGELHKTLTFSGTSLETKLRGIQQSIEGEEITNSGTTIAGIVIENRNALLFNIGDSRVYKICPNGIMYMSHDHSLVQGLVDSGSITDDEAFNHPHKNIIEFGMGDVFRTDWQVESKRVYIREDTLGPDEYYLICTDGVNDVVRDREIYELLHPDPFKGCPALIDGIKGRMKDNFSLIVLNKK